MHNPSHPGRILAYFLEGRSITAMAAHLGITRARLTRVLKGEADINAELALRLGEAFPNQDADFWLRLQAQRDLWVASRVRRKKVKQLWPPLVA